MGTRRHRRASTAARLRRHIRVRRRVHGTAERPRLAVYRSNTHIYCQVIDDNRQTTLISASDLEADLRAAGRSHNKTQQAQQVGARIADRAKAAGITHIVFDRGGFRYHGRVKALADAARAGGLQF
jgi:large subunit ribosomal protein L18